MTFTFAERFLMYKATIIRRVPPKTPISMNDLERYIALDFEEIRTATPDMYFADSFDLHDAIRECVDDGLLALKPEVFLNHTSIRVVRTSAGDRFSDTLSRHLQIAVSSLPMSSEGLLDYLATQ